jgi:hypothetical protein
MRWEEESVNVCGTRWMVMYLPMWQCIYRQPGSGMLQYSAVNERNGATMGSLPVQHRKLLLAALTT